MERVEQARETAVLLNRPIRVRFVADVLGSVGAHVAPWCSLVPDSLGRGTWDHPPTTFRFACPQPLEAEPDAAALSGSLAVEVSRPLVGTLGRSGLLWHPLGCSSTLWRRALGHVAQAPREHGGGVLGARQ